MADQAAEAKFEALGALVKPADVPMLVRAGRTVYSFGYGSELDEDDFVNLDESDLWAWDEGLFEPEREPDPNVVRSWGPFRVEPFDNPPFA